MYNIFPPQMEDSRLMLSYQYVQILYALLLLHTIFVLLLHSITLLHCMMLESKDLCEKKIPPYLFIHSIWMCSFHSIQGLILHTSLPDSRTGLHTAMYKICGDSSCYYGRHFLQYFKVDYNLLLVLWQREELLNALKWSDSWHLTILKLLI